MRGAPPSRLARSLLLTVLALLHASSVRADGGFPEPRQILLRADRPEQIILGTNFGLLLSEDKGATWLFSCEQMLSAYAGSYLLGAPSSRRIFALTSGAGLVYSDDDSCSWQAAHGKLSDVLPYAVAVDPSDSKRVYAIGVLREAPRAGESIYISDDGGVTFSGPTFTAPPQSALLTMLAAPSQPSTLFATMFSTPENHPILLRSRDSGENWEVLADLVSSLGENPFELLAIDPIDENTLHVRVMGASAETLATSHDGGLSFVQSVSIPGRLRAFLKLASGTILVGGTAGPDPLGYRSRDDGQSFEPWAEAPHVHALAERNGKVYVAAENFADGYAIAESDDEGEHLKPLAGFNTVHGVKGCAFDQCAESCAYYAGINLWPEAACGAQSPPRAPSDAGDAGTPADADAGAGAEDDGNGVRPKPEENAAVGAGRPGSDEADEPPRLRTSGGGCACTLVASRSADGPTLLTLLVVASMLVVGRRRRIRPHLRGFFARARSWLNTQVKRTCRARMSLSFSALALAAVAGLGCGAGETNPSPSAEEGSECASQGERFGIGASQVAKPEKLMLRIADCEPSPPAVRVDNVWRLEVSDSSGEAVKGAEIVVSPYMPKHQHGSPEVVVAELGDGSYELAPVELSMPGVWEIAIAVTAPAAETATATFRLCIAEE